MLWKSKSTHGPQLFMQNPHRCGHCITIRPQGDLIPVNLPFFLISNQPSEISKLKTHSSHSEHGNDTNHSN